METKVEGAGEGKANLVQTFSLDQWGNMVISKTQEIARKQADWVKEDAARVKSRADELGRKNAELVIAQNGYAAAGGNIDTLVIPEIQ